MSSSIRGLDALAPSLGATCAEYLERYRDGLAERLRHGESGVDVARSLSQVLDGLLSALFCAADAAARETAERPRVALVAVGGYGRGTLGLSSDVDLLFLTDDPSDRYPGALANGMLYPLWDLGVDLGHVVRGVGETLRLAREDVRTATTLVDARRIAGDVSICEELERGASRDVFQPALAEFLDALSEDTAARHERFGGSLYLLEPEVKLGRGGLRDLDVAEWAARARWGARSPADYVRTGALLRREVEELEAAREMLWRVRQHLHLRAGRKQDRLTFADQEEIATELGFVDGITLGVEQFMQAYYRHARVVAQTAERMLERARPVARRSRPPARDLGDGTSLFGEAVTLTATSRLAEDPTLAFRLYHQVVRHGLRPYAYARDAIARASVDPGLRDTLRKSEEATQLFLQLVSSGGVPVLPRSSMVTELHEVGLLVAMVPELEPLVGRVVHDVYNVYTVDVHALRAVDRFREIRAGDHARDMPLASRLAAETPRRVPLVLALLLHGLGRVHGGNDRERGAAAAEVVARRLGLGRRDAELVAFLVEEQRGLYHWATRRDTHDPATLAELADRVGSKERLRELLLMTVCTLSTTNATAYSSWTARMIEDLYFGLLRTLAEGPDARGARAEELRAEVHVGFVGDAGREVLDAFLEDMPDRYVLGNAVDDVRRHARIVRDTPDDRIVLVLGPGPSPELAEVVLRVEDRPGLLADVAAAFAGQGLSIVDAQVYTHEGRVFDVFWVRREKGRVDAALLSRVERDLRALFEGTTDAETLIKRARPPAWARRRRPDVATQVGVDNAASPRFTVVDVFTRDGVGVLHHIASALHQAGVRIALSKVNTEGERVADVFYVTDESGEKLAGTRLETLREELASRVTEMQREERESERPARRNGLP